MYGLQILDAAARDLARLDKPVGRRVADRINWLAANLEAIKPEALSGDLVGFYKLRVGDYRPTPRPGRSAPCHSAGAGAVGLARCER